VREEREEREDEVMEEYRIERERGEMTTYH
jgi:hypothetical protein